MKVLVVTNLYPPTVVGGYEISCAQVVDDLRRRGHEVRVLTSVPDVLVDGPDHVQRTLRRTDTFSTERPDARSDLWEVEANLIDSGNVFELISAVRDFRPDVCHLWNLIGLGGVALVGVLEYLGLPWVWHLGDAVPAYLSIFDGTVLPLAKELGKRMTGRFVAVSQSLVTEIEHIVPLGDRVRLVPNWVMDEDGPLEREWFDGGTLRVAFAGQLAEHKGTHVLVDAVSLVRGQGLDVTVDFFGTGDRDGLLARITSAGVADVAHLRGWVPQAELRRQLRTFDLFAFPTWEREPFAIAPLEAGAAGCVPLITTPSGPAEWLVDGVHCLKAARTPEAFADVIASVCRGEVALGPLGRRASAIVRQDFVLSRVVPMIEEELALAASSGPHPQGDPDSVYKMVVIAEALVRSAVGAARATTAANGASGAS